LQSKRQAIPAGSSLMRFDCSKLAAGIYQLSSMDENKHVTTTRFVKQ
jgi:hypothetical protein